MNFLEIMGVAFIVFIISWLITLIFYGGFKITHRSEKQTKTWYYHNFKFKTYTRRHKPKEPHLKVVDKKKEGVEDGG